MEFIRSRGRQTVWAALLVVVLLHFSWLAIYHAPAISTPDANSYFAQARWIAQKATTSFALESPVQFIGPHWNAGANGRYYCTHPPGLGVVLAIPYLLLGYGAATWVNPLLASMSIIMVFLLCRRSTGPWWALLAAALVALNPFGNEHALFGDSHVAVRFALLSALVCLARMRSARSSAAWGLAAGLLAGTIPTLRYPALLYLATLALFVAWMAYRRRVTLGSASAFLLGAALPLVVLLARNQMAYGGFWRTGYMATGEQAAFSVAALLQHAPMFVWKLLAEGAWLMFPLGVVGMLAMLSDRETRAQAWLWIGLIAPVTLLYMAWYWRPDPESMRFLLPTFPLYTVAGVWMLSNVIRRPRTALWTCAGVLTATALWGVPPAVMSLRHLERDGRVLADITAMLQRHVPPASVVIAGIGIQQHLDFVGRWKLADAGLVRVRPPDAPRGKGPGALVPERQRLRELPARARWGAFVQAVWEWAGDGGRAFLLAKPAEAIRWARSIPDGTHLQRLDGIELPVGQTPWRRRPDERGRADVLPAPDPNSIFDLSLDGGPLELFELEH